jgi:hypothetical protein
MPPINGAAFFWRSFMFRYHCVFALGLLPFVAAGEARRLMVNVDYTDANREWA